MESRSATWRKRPVTACSECYRRKQKCNRKRPCSNCIARQVPDKCTYGDQPHISTPEVTSRSNVTSAEAVQSGPVSTDDHYSLVLSQASSLPDQMGYSYETYSNTFSGLREGLTRGDGPRAIPSQFPEPFAQLSPSQIDKYYDLVAQLPPDFVVRELVDTYFREANWYFGLLEKYYFEKLYTTFRSSMTDISQESRLQKIPKDAPYFPALLFQVLAVALQFLLPNSPSARILQITDPIPRDRLSDRYSDKGMEVMSTLGRIYPTITAVQQDLVRAFWLKNSSRGREAWHLTGSAIRMAQELGLHLEPEAPQQSALSVEATLSKLWMDEYKKRLWIKLFSWDSHMAFNYGRPRTINASDCTIKPPVDTDIPLDPLSQVPMPSTDPPSSFTPHLFQYELAQKTHDLMSAGANRGNVKDYEIVRMTHEHVTSMLASLPAVLRPENPDMSYDSRMPHLSIQRLQIANTAYSFLMALHRPLAAIYEASREAAVREALKVLNTQEQLFALMGNRHFKIYMLSSYTIDASLYLSITIAKFPVKDFESYAEIKRALHQGIRRLEWMKERSPLAKSAEPVLKYCFGLMEKSAMFDRAIHPQPTSTLQSNSMSTEQYSTDHISGISPAISPIPHDGYRNMQSMSNSISTSSLDDDTSSAMFAGLTQSNYDTGSFMAQLAEFQDQSATSEMTQGQAWDLGL